MHTFRAIYELVLIFLCFSLTLFIHEIGHFLAGRLCKFSFVELKVLFVSVSKKGVSFHKKPDSYCIMNPEIADNKKSRLILYTTGGCIFNIIYFILLIGIYFIIPSVLSIVHSTILVSANISLFLGIYNMIPWENKGVENDGMHLIYCLKCPDLFIKTLAISKNLAEGVRYKDMEKSLFDFQLKSRKGKMEAGLVRQLAIARYYSLLDCGRFREAKVWLLQITPLSEKSQTLWALVYLEFFFLDLLLKKQTHEELRKQIESSTYKKAVKLSGYRPVINRILYLYLKKTGGNYKQQFNKSEKYLNKPYGDVKTELAILKSIA